jgi:hypothetical protein
MSVPQEVTEWLANCKSIDFSKVYISSATEIYTARKKIVKWLVNSKKIDLSKVCLNDVTQIIPVTDETMEWLTDFKKIELVEKHSSNVPRNTFVSRKTIKWLLDFQGGNLSVERLSSTTNDMLHELSPYTPKEPIRLYCGIAFDTETEEIPHTRKVFTSWYKEIEIARRIAKSDPNMIYGAVVSVVLSNSNILCDTSLLKFLPEGEGEVIVFPGTYRLDIIEYVSCQQESEIED